LAPVPVPLLQKPQPTDALPACDYLAVTWTVAEAKALADVLTPGCDSRTDWYPYAKDFDTIYAPLILELCQRFLRQESGWRWKCITETMRMWSGSMV